MRQSYGHLVGVLALALIVCGFAPTAASAQGTPAATPANLESEATFATEPCPFPVPDPLVEGESLECGFLTTPLLHADPDGEQIRLFVIRLASPASEKLETPLVYLAGGPGQGGAGQLTGFLPEGPLYPIVEQQDVILIDQRGTGFSEPGLFCPTDAEPGIVGLTSQENSTPAAATPQPESTSEAASILVGGFSEQQVGDCRSSFETQGIDLTAFSSAESAADINDLRVALGYDQVDLYGVSYGSALGLVIERDFPSIVRAAVLGSPAPLQVDRFNGQVVAFDQSLDEAIAQCEADPDCAAANPDLSENFDLAVEQLNAEPLDVELVDPTTEESLGSFSMDGELFMFAVYEGLYIAPSIVPSLITGAVNGETDSSGAILGVAYSVIQSSIATGLNHTINCTEEYPFVDSEEEILPGAENDVRDSLANSEQFNVVMMYDEICGLWDLPAADPVEAESVVSDVPTLILTGEFDPITPPGYGELAVETLENGYVIEIPGASHDPVGLAGPAGVQLIVDFMADPSQRPDTSVVEQNQVDFSPDQ